MEGLWNQTVQGKRELIVRYFVSTLARVQSRSSRSNILTCVGLTVLPRVMLLMLRQRGWGSNNTKLAMLDMDDFPYILNKSFSFGHHSQTP